MFLWIETADKSIKKQYHFFVLSFWDIWIDMRKKRFKKNAQTIYVLINKNN